MEIFAADLLHSGTATVHKAVADHAAKQPLTEF